MPLCLRPGLSFCRVADRVIFLDLAADRYFCLSAPAEVALMQYLDEGDRSGPSAELASLRTMGLLNEQAGCRIPAPCAAPTIPEVSLLDEPLPHVGAMPIVTALGDLAASRVRLKALGLNRTLAAIRRRKAKLADDHNPHPDYQLRRTIAAFRGADGIISTLDNCLSQSVAVAGRLLREGVATTLVIGVRLGPFNAHCWVQRGDRLVNDRFDMVRMFTPILVV